MPRELTPEQLTRDEKLCEEATAGPYRVVPDPSGGLMRHWVVIRAADGRNVIDVDSYLASGEEHSGVWMTGADAAFFARAREGWPATQRDLRAAEAELAAARAEIASLRRVLDSLVCPVCSVSPGQMHRLDCEMQDAGGCSHWHPTEDARALLRKLKEARAERDDICGLCGLPGADKIPHPEHWPGERIPGTDLVHSECEQAECGRAHAVLTDEQRRAALRSIW